MIIALFPNVSRQNAKNVGIDVCKFLRAQGVSVVTDDQDATELGALPLSTLSKPIDFMIVIGGDGTLLRTMHRYNALNVPVLGINLGGLGFMTDVPLSDLYPSLQDLLNGNFDVEERLMLAGQKGMEEPLEAINEITIHRSHCPALVDLSVHIDDLYVNTFSADGLIIATPNGSTAYSLSAGGPIITPQVDAILITPICPHTISNRPIVLMPKDHIKISHCNKAHPVELSFDGRVQKSLNHDEVLTIYKSQRMFKWVHLHRHDYFSTLRTKLGWSGNLKQK